MERKRNNGHGMVDVYTISCVEHTLHASKHNEETPSVRTWVCVLVLIRWGKSKLPHSRRSFINSEQVSYWTCIRIESSGLEGGREGETITRTLAIT